MSSESKMIASGIKHAQRMQEVIEKVNSPHYASGYVIGDDYEKLGEAMAALLTMTKVDEFEDRAHALIADMMAFWMHKNK